MNKNILFIIEIPLFFLLIFSGIIQSGCKKNTDSSPPVISGVHAVDSTKRDSMFLKAFPGDLIVITGQNLDGLQAVYFNDSSAYFNPTYATNNNIIIAVPNTAPTSPPAASVSNTIRVVTNHGSSEYTFTIVLRPPVITSVSNENAIAGTTIEIRGTNFYGISSVIFPGSIAVTNFHVNNPASISVKVPPGITSGGVLQVTGDFGSATSSFVFGNWLSPTIGFLANFDNASSADDPPDDNPYYGWTENTWVGNLIKDPSLFPGGTGPMDSKSYCIQINPQQDKPAGDNSWWQDAGGIILDQGTWVANPDEPINNYALKFEAYLKKPWTQGAIWISPGRGPWNYMASWAPWKKSNGGDGSFESNGWITVTIPLTNLYKTDNGWGYTASGIQAATIADLQQKLGGLLMFMYANDGEITIPGNSFDLAIDNVRIAKIK